jgi:peptidoglycan/LPS O-acetylase OafA/YrhL
LLLNSGVDGVQLFFVVSAFTLMRSWTERADGAGPFYLRRLFRIAPMWWLAIFGWAVARAVVPGHLEQSSMTGWDLLAGVTFLHAWSVTALNTVVPGGWSVASEAMFYLIFPLLAAILTTSLRAVAFAMLAVLFTITLQARVELWVAPFASAAARADFFYFWFPRQLPVFALGIAAFHAARTTSPPHWLRQTVVGLALAGILILPFATPAPDGLLAYAVVFSLLIYGMSQGAGGYLTNGVMKWIGQRSYSAYFWHLAIVVPAPHWPMPFPLRLLTVLALTFALSDPSYRFVEQPGIRLGKRVIAALRRPAAAAVPASSET